METVLLAIVLAWVVGYVVWEVNAYQYHKRVMESASYMESLPSPSLSALQRNTLESRERMEDPWENPETLLDLLQEMSALPSPPYQEEREPSQRDLMRAAILADRKLAMRVWCQTWRDLRAESESR